MGGEDFDMDDPCDVLKLEMLKSKVCFVSENVDEDNARMGETCRRWRCRGRGGVLISCVAIGLRP